jgi:hypothetical protein
MSIRTLRHISHQALPLTIQDPRKIAIVRSLAVGGLVRASVPQPQRTSTGAIYEPAVTVLEITRLGWMVLATFSDEEPPSRHVEPCTA